MKALVVDDEPAFCEVLRDFLVEKGYHVVVASDGDEAIRLYKQDRPDIVLMDVQMPGKNGLETLRELKAHDPKAAFIIVSAVEDFETVQQAKAEGVFFIHKPINFHSLELAIETNL
jgi:DNA-binding response OmpR family regulator